jgi:hypothetical protein
MSIKKGNFIYIVLAIDFVVLLTSIWFFGWLELKYKGYTKIFNMEKKVTNCPTFIVCKDTQNRNNRVLSTGAYFGSTTANNSTKSSLVNIRTYWDSVPQPANLKNECNCAMGTRNTDSKLCACKTGRFGIVR